MNADRSASVLARLLNRSRDTGENYNLLLSRFVIERLLYRLSQSRHANNFVLKGALLFSLWYGTPHRPTKDADLLGFGADDADTLRTTFTEVCALDVDDGVRYDTESMRIEPIREDNVYGGLRLTVLAFMGSARLPVQVDIGFGDAITPSAEFITYPTVLEGLDSPRLRAYPVYTVVAEKAHAMVVLELANSRMKDFFDLHVIASSTPLSGLTLLQAVRATFDRRGTAMPTSEPVALTASFATHRDKVRQWSAFQSKANLKPVDLESIVNTLRELLLPVLLDSSTDPVSPKIWNPDQRHWRLARANDAS